MKTRVTHQELRQLLFLDNSIYQVGYEKTQGGYDLVIGFNSDSVGKEETRRRDMRERIVGYLWMRYEEWCGANGEVKSW